MSKFLTELDTHLKCDSDNVWVLGSPLVYDSDLVGRIEVPSGFETDFASVPRVPIFYMLFGDRAHREAVLHDYLYRIDAAPLVTYSQANKVFLEAMALREKSVFIRYPMWWGVVLGGWTAWKKKHVTDIL